MQVIRPLHFHIDDSARTELDLRHLPSPEPMLRALEAADALLPGQSVQVLTPLLPMPLLDALATRGLYTSAVTLPGGTARVLICRRDDDDPTGA
jgi:uncharacterized protein (DUF2249 family)